MSLALALATYLVFWWLTLFMVLPWGVRRAEAEDLEPGEDPGAPANPMLLIKFAVTTLVSGLFFAIFYWVYTSGLISFRYEGA